MNKLILLISMAACLSSCKKTYTCECYTTFTYMLKDNTFRSIVIPGNSAAYSEKLHEKQARSACQHEEIATQTNLMNAMTDTGRFPLRDGESIITSCGLK